MDGIDLLAPFKVSSSVHSGGCISERPVLHLLVPLTYACTLRRKFKSKGFMPTKWGNKGVAERSKIHLESKWLGWILTSYYFYCWLVLLLRVGLISRILDLVLLFRWVSSYYAWCRSAGSCQPHLVLLLRWLHPCLLLLGWEAAGTRAATLLEWNYNYNLPGNETFTGIGSG